MCMQAPATSSKRWTWFAEDCVRVGLRQEGDDGNHQSKQNQRKNDGSADFILFWLCVVSVVVRRVVCHAAKITDSSAFLLRAGATLYAALVFECKGLIIFGV